MRPVNALEFDGINFALDGEPLEAYVTMAGLPPALGSVSGGDRYGYWADWSILDGRLYLTALHHDICCEEERAERAFCLQDVFPGYTNRVFAHWYSSVDWCRPISPDEENESSSEETEGVRILSFRRGIVTSDSCVRVKRPEPQPAIS